MNEINLLHEPGRNLDGSSNLDGNLDECPNLDGNFVQVRLTLTTILGNRKSLRNSPVAQPRCDLALFGIPRRFVQVPGRWHCNYIAPKITSQRAVTPSPLSIAVEAILLALSGQRRYSTLTSGGGERRPCPKIGTSVKEIDVCKCGIAAVDCTYHKPPDTILEGWAKILGEQVEDYLKRIYQLAPEKPPQP